MKRILYITKLAVAALLGCDESNRVAIVKYANGGTELKIQWKAGGDANPPGSRLTVVVLHKNLDGFVIRSVPMGRGFLLRRSGLRRDKTVGSLA